MFFVGFFQQTKPRRRAEDRFSRLSMFAAVVHLAAFAYGLLMATGKMTSTTTSSFGAATFGQNNEFIQVDTTCANVTRYPDNALTSMERFGQTYELHVDQPYAVVLWNRCLGSIVNMLVWNGVLIGLSFLNKAWFEWGRQSIRIRSIVIHQTTLVTAQLMCAIMALVYMSNAYQQGEILRRWNEGCNRADRWSAMLVTPDFALYAAVGIDLAMQVTTFCLYLYYGHRKCHLDYDIIDIRADGCELITKRNDGVLINNVPLKRDRLFIEAYKASLQKATAEEADERRLESSQYRDWQPLRPSPHLTFDPEVIADLAEADRRHIAAPSRAAHNAPTEMSALPSHTSGPTPYFMDARGRNAPVAGSGNTQRSTSPGHGASYLPNRRDRSATGRRVVGTNNNVFASASRPNGGELLTF